MGSKRTLKTRCIALDDYGRGIIKEDGYTMFIDDLLPSEEAVIDTYFSYGKFNRALIKERITTSSDRVKPACKYFKSCGGCQLMHLSYDKQLEFKRDKVKSLLHKFASIDIDVEDTMPVDDPYRFRNKVQKPIQDIKGKGISAGFYKKDSHSLVKIDDCLIESQLSNKITRSIVDLIKSFGYKAYDEETNTGLIRHLLIKTSTDDKALVTIVSTSEKLKDKDIFAKKIMSQNKEVVGVVLNINNKKTNVILGDKDILLSGKSYITDTIFDNRFLISSHSFYQTNSKQIENLYSTAISFASLKEGDVVLDAYCGTGTIGLSLARRVKEVIGVELNRDAYKDAIKNAKINDINNASFINDDCTDYMLNTKQKFDVIIMDPPRKGSTKEFIDACIRINPRTIVYVSCDPVTLARDINLFKDNYELVKVQPVDMFPHTSHVETVCKLIRK